MYFLEPLIKNVADIKPVTKTAVQCKVTLTITTCAYSRHCVA